MNKEFSSTINRRQFIKMTTAGATAATMGFPAIVKAGTTTKSMIILGIDGMDPSLTLKFVNDGLMPNTRKLIKNGSFSPLGTSDPPQSPVAWSNFISGTNPGGHGIYDFIVRDPTTMTPYLSTSRMEGEAFNLSLGNWQIPLSGREMINQRKGPTFWNSLQEDGVDCRIIKIPSNFPPGTTQATTLSGLGTPDIHGSYGIFTFYTDRLREISRDLSGGRIEKVKIKDSFFKCRLPGPRNSLNKKNEPVDINFRVYRDPVNPNVKIQIQDKKFILKEGEWSRWIPVKFEMLPNMVSAKGCCRFYLKKAHAPFELYVSPVNIDPLSPFMPISTPDDYSRRMAGSIGRFYTQGMPEDTSALSADVLSDSEYREQALYVLKERTRMFEHEFNRFHGGLLFFYFSSIDLNSHAFWRTMDPAHPLYTRKLAEEHGDFIPSLYRKMDRIIGSAMELINSQTDLLVISDHGFGPFRRKFHLNSWLMDHGYAAPSRPAARGQSAYFANIDWGQTTAYGLGLNGLYLNVKGREAQGTVQPSQKKEISNKIKQHLETITDPKTGQKVVSRVCLPDETYCGPYTEQAPDLLVCYNLGYRASWETIIGKYPMGQLADNNDPWSGDHALDSRLIPGTLLTNMKLKSETPALSDLAPSILNRFKTRKPEEMTGREVF